MASQPTPAAAATLLQQLTLYHKESLFMVSPTSFVNEEVDYYLHLFVYTESPLNTTGFWNFQCTDGNINGTVSVVPGLHIKLVTATVPQDCYAIGINDVVLWLDGDGETCQKNIIVESDAGVDFTSNLTGKA